MRWCALMFILNALKFHYEPIYRITPIKIPASLQIIVKKFCENYETKGWTKKYKNLKDEIKQTVEADLKKTVFKRVSPRGFLLCNLIFDTIYFKGNEMHLGVGSKGADIKAGCVLNATIKMFNQTIICTSIKREISFRKILSPTENLFNVLITDNPVEIVVRGALDELKWIIEKNRIKISKFSLKEGEEDYLKEDSHLIDLTGQSIAILKAGTKIKIIKLSDKFVYVNSPKGKGYVESKNISPFRVDKTPPVIRLFERKIEDAYLYLKGIVLDDNKVKEVKIDTITVPKSTFEVSSGIYEDVYPFEYRCFVFPTKKTFTIIAEDTAGNKSELTFYLSEIIQKKTGRIIDKNTQKPISNAKIVIRNLETGEKFVTYTNEKGEYSLSLPPGGKYSVSIEAKGYVFSSSFVDLKDKKSYYNLMEDIALAPIKKGEKIILRNIFFDFDSYELKPESKYELDRLIRIMKEHKSMVVEIAGHTDDIGTEEYNLRLSQKRAEAVKQYLVEHGIEPQRIIAKGYGKSQPLIADTTEEARALNRRVEFKILKY